MAILNEEINYKIERTKNGTPIAYIDPKTSDNVYDFKEIIKKYGGKWDAYNKRWFWWLSTDKDKTQEILNNYLNPAIEQLTKVETSKGAKRNPSDVQAQVAKMINDLDKILASPVSNNGKGAVSESDVKTRVASFKEKLVNITSSEEFKRLLGPIIKFKQALGHQYSFGNTILIWIQDPEATMVKSKTRWGKVNRIVKPNSPAIMLYVPVGLEPYTPEEKKEITDKFLKKCDVKSVKELTPGQKEILSVKLTGGNPKDYKLSPTFYDHRFTEPIKGKEDLAPKGDTSDIDWFDDKSPASEKTIALFDSAIASIKESGIKFSYVNDLGGARGVSMNGEIRLLADCGKNKNIGDFNTAVHEFSHELLHQKYLKSTNEGSYGSFFVGTEKGRGMVEQQAELSAWIICQYFGYEMPTSINYMGCWGMDSKSAANVFDTVANTSSYIIEIVMKNLNNSTLQESMESRSSIITGKQIADMVGLGKLYDKSKQMQQPSMVSINQNDIREMVAESVKRILKENFSDLVQWNHFENGPTNTEMFNDAVEAIEMSDGMIDFVEWYPAFQDYIEPDEAEVIFNKALEQCGY